MLENEKKRRALIAVAIFFIFGLIVPLNSLLISLSLTPEDRAKLLMQMENFNNKGANP